MKNVLLSLCVLLLGGCSLNATCSFNVNRLDTVGPDFRKQLISQEDGFLCEDVIARGKPQQRVCQKGSHVEIMKLAAS